MKAVISTPTTPDPTMQILERLKNPSAWDHIDRGVPIFKPHIATLRHPGTGESFQVNYDVPRLERMVAILHRITERSGVVPRLTVGHTRHPQTEITQEEQPEIVGYAANPRVGTFGPTNTPAILIDRYFLPGTWDKAKSYPYRSPEFYPAEVAAALPGAIEPDNFDAITSIALLRTDPKLDMGLTTYAQSAHVYRYAMENDMSEPMDTPPMPAPTPAPAPIEPGLDDQFMEQFRRCMGREYPHLSQYYRDCVASKYEASAPAAPSSTNVALLAEPKPEPKPPEPTHMQRPAQPTIQTPVATPAPVPAISPVPSHLLEDAVRQYSDQLASQKAHYDRSLALMQQQITALQSDNVAKDNKALVAQYERDLGSLMHAGYDFVLADEMKDCLKPDGTPIPQADFDRHKSRIQKHYSRKPVDPAHHQLGFVNGMQIVPDSALNISTPSPDEKQPTKADGHAAVLYFEEHKKEGISYKQALDAVVNQRLEKKTKKVA